MIDINNYPRPVSELIKEEFGVNVVGDVHSENSIPPRESLRMGVAETNLEAKILTWEEFINQEGNPEPWLIEGILRPGWLAVLGGHGKHGKSTLALHLLNAIRFGDTFITPCKPAPALYLNFEMAEDDVRDIVKAITANSSPRAGKLARIINSPPLPLDFKWLEKTLNMQDEPGVCVIDSFRAAFMLAGETENQAGTVGGILRRLQNIARRTKWAIIVIHHFRKSGKGEALDLAGSGEWLSAPDVVLTWTCPNITQAGTLNIIGRVPPWEPVSIELSRDYIAFLGRTSEYEAETQRQKIKEALDSNWLTTEEVIKKVNASFDVNTKIPDATIRRYLNYLFNKVEIMKEGKGIKGNPRRWRIKSISKTEELEPLAPLYKPQNGNGELVKIEDLPEHLQYYTRPEVIERYEKEMGMVNYATEQEGD